MKGDEVVELGEERSDLGLLGERGNGDAGIGEIVIVQMNDGLPLGFARQLVMLLPPGNAQRRIDWIKSIARINDV